MNGTYDMTMAAPVTDEVTADGCRFRQEMSAGGGPFTLIMEGTARKAK